MSQRTIDVFSGKTYSKPPKKNYSTSKTDVYPSDDVSNLDILGLKDYGPSRGQ